MRLYEGQSRNAGQEEVTPADLASADIVVTTYNTLARDIYHQPDITQEVVHNLRHKRKYEVLPLTLSLSPCLLV